MQAYYEARAPEYDDWYLRLGRYARGPVHDLAWNTELDRPPVARQLPLQGEIVELAAGTGWWSTLLAGKGALSLYDANAGPLERARSRLSRTACGPTSTCAMRGPRRIGPSMPCSPASG